MMRRSGIIARKKAARNTSRMAGGIVSSVWAPNTAVGPSQRVGQHGPPANFVLPDDHTPDIAEQGGDRMMGTALRGPYKVTSWQHDQRRACTNNTAEDSCAKSEEENKR